MLLKSLNRIFVKKRYAELNANLTVKDNFEKISEYFRNDFKKGVVIVCIGTNRTHSVDCLGPFVGSILKEDKGFDYPVYGSIIDPIHAANLAARIIDINKAHKYSIIIGVDACLSNKNKIGRIIVKDEPLQPGRGIGKCCEKVGEKCIKGVVGFEGMDVVDYYANLSFISDMAWTIAKGLKKAAGQKL